MDSFKIFRGIRQGCPVSPILFIICVEVLGIRIRSSQCLAGFDFGHPQKPIKISQYADDGIVFLKNRNDMCSALNILETFGEISGLKLNVEKCEVFGWEEINYCKQTATCSELSGRSNFNA